jgi:DnaK suppressor protein
MNAASHGKRASATPADPTPSGAPPRPPMPAPPRRPAPVDEGPAELTRAEVDELKRLLDEHRAQVSSMIEARRSQEREAGREVGDEMDEANTEGVTALASKLLERDVHLLREIDHAMAKIADGSYGICEGTGEPIGYARLRLRPWARYGVAYQEEIERAQRARGGP